MAEENSLMKVCSVFLDRHGWNGSSCGGPCGKLCARIRDPGDIKRWQEKWIRKMPGMT